MQSYCFSMPVLLRDLDTALLKSQIKGNYLSKLNLNLTTIRNSAMSKDTITVVIRCQYVAVTAIHVL